MEEVKKDKTSCNVIIIIILMIMVLGLGGYIFYEKAMSKDSNVTTPKTEEKTEELDEKCKTVEIVDLSEEQLINEITSALELINPTGVSDVNITKIDDYFYSVSCNLIPKEGAYQVSGFAYRENGKWNIKNLGSGHTIDEFEKLKQDVCK